MAHDIIVKVALTPEEYLALRSLCDESGASQSSFTRQLIKRAIADFVKASSDSAGSATPETGQD